MLSRRVSRMSPGTRGTSGEGRGTAGKRIRDRSARPDSRNYRRAWTVARLGVTARQASNPFSRSSRPETPGDPGGYLYPRSATKIRPNERGGCGKHLSTGPSMSGRCRVVALDYPASVGASPVGDGRVERLDGILLRASDHVHVANRRHQGRARKREWTGAPCPRRYIIASAIPANPTARHPGSSIAALARFPCSSERLPPCPAVHCKFKVTYRKWPERSIWSTSGAARPLSFTARRN